jgi:hypothetical protein
MPSKPWVHPVYATVDYRDLDTLSVSFTSAKTHGAPALFGSGRMYFSAAQPTSINRLGHNTKQASPWRHIYRFSMLGFLLWSASAHAATLSGTVRSSQGVDIANADVYAVNAHLAAASTQSNDQGEYTFLNLPAGGYRVWALPPVDDVHISQFYPDADEFCDGRLISVAANTSASNIDFSLPTGTSLEGQVFNVDGDGVQNVRVRADALFGSISRHSTTDRDGYFRVNGLQKDDTWQLQAAISGTPVQWAGPSYSKDDADIFDPDDNSDVGAWTLLEGIGVLGTVHGPDGPVPDADVRIYAQSQLVQTTTDANGFFEATGLPPGEVTAWAHAPGLATTYFPNHDRPTDTIDATQEGVWVDGLDLMMPLEATVGIQLEGVAPRTSGVLSGVSVVLYNDTQSVGRSAQTDANGLASFGALHGGRYTAFIYGAQTGHPDDWARTETGAIWEINLEPEVDNPTYTVILPPAVTIAGTVTDDDGNPVPGVSVLVSPDDDQPGGQFYLGKTDTEGHFAVVGIPQGLWRLRTQTDPPCASDPGYVPVYWPDEVDPLMAESLQISVNLPITTINFIIPKDKDQDWMSDRWEQRYHLDPNKNDAMEDPDLDGLNNLTEYRLRTDPHTPEGEWVLEHRCGCSTTSPRLSPSWLILVFAGLRRRDGARLHKSVRQVY